MYGVMSTAWGGDSEFVEISYPTKISKNCWGQSFLVAEIQEPKADPTVKVSVRLAEARLDKGKGAVATFSSNKVPWMSKTHRWNTFGRVRAMTNDLVVVSRSQAHQRRFLSQV